MALVGGSGFVGSALAAQLSKSYRVRILDRNRPSSGTYEFVACDIRNYDEVAEALTGVDLVIHTAIIQIPQINEERRLGYEVNILGSQNVCEAVRNSPIAKGMILAGSWHTIGERKIEGVIDEKFGFRPDMVEDRARLYALSKIGQEAIVRMYHETERNKVYGVIRIGTVLGNGMPPQSAANLFIENGLKGRPLTPFEHSMHRPMLYVDIHDVCDVFESFAAKILGRAIPSKSSSDDVYNAYYPEPVTILELAHIVKQCIKTETSGRIDPPVRIISGGGQETIFSPADKSKIVVNIGKLREVVGSKTMTSPEESVRRIVRDRLGQGATL
jgi:UDP-glucose 4-epimerase